MQILEYLETLRHEVTEVRILRSDPYLMINGRREYVGKTISGYYDRENYQKLVSDIQNYEADPNTTAIWTTLQRCSPDLLARSANRLKQATETTLDAQITDFVVFPIDVDSGQPAGVSASEAELEKSKAVATDLAKTLTDLGIPIVKAFSGNGWHVLIYLSEPLPNTAENAKRWKLVGDVLVLLYGTDEKNYNPARCWKVYGTTAKKGDSVGDRKHRKAQIWEPTDPAAIERVSFEALESAILPLAPTTETYAHEIPTAESQRAQTVRHGKKITTPRKPRRFRSTRTRMRSGP